MMLDWLARATRHRGARRRGAPHRTRRSTPCSRPGASCRSSSAAATAPRPSPLRWPPTSESAACTRCALPASAPATSASSIIAGWRAIERRASVRGRGATPIRRKRARRSPISFGIDAVFSDLRHASQAVQPDLVDIVTPPQTHRALVAVVRDAPFAGRSARSRSRRRTPTRWRSSRTRERAGVPLRRCTRISAGSRGTARRSACSMPARSARCTAWPFACGPATARGRAPISIASRTSSSMPRLLVYETAIHWIDTFRFLWARCRRCTATPAPHQPGDRRRGCRLSSCFEFDGGATGLFDGNRAQRPCVEQSAAHDGRDVARRLGRRAAARWRRAPVVEAAPGRRDRARLRPRPGRHLRRRLPAKRCSATWSRICATVHRSRTRRTTTSPTCACRRRCTCRRPRTGASRWPASIPCGRARTAPR